MMDNRVWDPWTVHGICMIEEDEWGISFGTKWPTVGVEGTDVYWEYHEAFSSIYRTEIDCSDVYKVGMGR